MNLYETLSLIVSTAGFIGLVFSIRMLSTQTREVAVQSQSSVKALEANTFDASATTMFLIDTTFIEHPELRKYFYYSAPLQPDGDERDRALGMAELLLDHFDYILLQMKWFPTLYPANFWTDYIKDCFSVSPVLCHYLNERSHWYSAELKLMMQKGFERGQEQLGQLGIQAS